MRIRSILTAFLAATASCSVEERRPAASDTSRPETNATSARPDTASPSTPKATTTNWTVTPDGIGAIRAGMRVDELSRVAGDVRAANASAECSYVHPSAAPHGVMIMLARGQVARVDVDSAGVMSDAGVAVGDSAARVTDAYAGRVTATPHKYVPGGQYLTVRPVPPADSPHRMVFETENGRVTRFRSGRVPEVEWVERCG